MPNRRFAVLALPALVAAPALSACSGGEDDVGAVEDLMREHGILRRAILVFRESAGRLRASKTVDAAALHKTAQLFRSFGEDYHERKLEEVYIFPALRKAGGSGGRDGGHADRPTQSGPRDHRPRDERNPWRDYTGTIPGSRVGAVRVDV